MRDGPICIGRNSAKREEVNVGDVEIGVCGLVGGKMGDDLVWLVGQEQFGHIHRAFLQHFEGGAHAAGNGELDQGL